MLYNKTNITPLIMVTYFRPNSLKICVDSILSNTKLPYKLYIIDNSHGNINATLISYENNNNIVIYKNSANIGKGAAFMRCYNNVIKKHDIEHFISIDPDIEVGPNWLSKMLTAKNRIKRQTNFGILAPIFQNEKNNKLAMHVTNINTHEIIDSIYVNRYTAGPLLLIDKNFFNAVNGYPTNQLYGNEDGYLCKKANNRNLFAGFTTSITVNHLAIDDDDEYVKWKKRNAHGNIDHKGRWD